MPVFIAFIVEAGWTILTYLFNTVVLKFLVGTVFYIVIHGVMGYAISNLLPNGANISSNISGFMGQFSPQIWYCLDLLDFSFGASLVMAALVTRFTIKFIPKL